MREQLSSTELGVLEDGSAASFAHSQFGDASKESPRGAEHFGPLPQGGVAQFGISRCPPECASQAVVVGVGWSQLVLARTFQVEPNQSPALACVTEGGAAQGPRIE